MITEAILNFFIGIISNAFELLPAADNMVINLEAVQQATYYIWAISWILPVAELMQIFKIVVALKSFELIYAIILKAKSLVPMWGN